MKTRVQKWGNSLALRVPKSFADELGFRDGSPVEMSLDEGAIAVRPDRERTFDLDTLLAGVTEENIHAEWTAEGDGPGAGAAEDKP